MHRHAGGAALTAPAAPAVEECPMHHHGGATAHARPNTAHTTDTMRCACAGQVQALIANAVVAGVLPAVADLEAPRLARAPRTSIAEAPLGLADSPPAPPPRA
jgi:hypothetical protein